MKSLHNTRHEGDTGSVEVQVAVTLLGNQPLERPHQTTQKHATYRGFDEENRFRRSLLGLPS